MILQCELNIPCTLGASDGSKVADSNVIAFTDRHPRNGCVWGIEDRRVGEIDSFDSELQILLLGKIERL